MDRNDIKPGYVYHIKDTYFDVAQDDKLINAAFLLQNMFPVLPKYIDHIHTVKQNPVPVDTRLQIVISRNFRELLRLCRLGVKIVFPDILRLEKLMLDEQIADMDDK